MRRTGAESLQAFGSGYFCRLRLQTGNDQTAPGLPSMRNMFFL